MWFLSDMNDCGLGDPWNNQENRPGDDCYYEKLLFVNNKTILAKIN